MKNQPEHNIKIDQLDKKVTEYIHHMHGGIPGLTPRQTPSAMNKKIEAFTYSGTNLIDEVNALNPNRVVDVGCGTNYFKNKIKNLIGFDAVAHPDLDFQSEIKDVKFEPNSADVVLALGSLQFGNRDYTYRDLKTVIGWVRPGGYIVMRLRPLVTEAESVISELPYIWSQEWVEQLGQEFGLDVVKGPYVDNNAIFVNSARTVWWWQKRPEKE